MAITDDFNRADGWIGANYETVYGNAWRIVSNTARPANANYRESLVVRNEKTFPANHYAQAKCEFTGGAENSLCSPNVRTQPDGNCYYVVLSTAGVELRRRTSPSSASYIADWLSTLVAGTQYTVKIDANGTTIKVYIDGTERISVTDANLSGGKPGFSQGTAGGTYARVDDFECTDATDATLNTIYRYGYGDAVSGTGDVTPAIPLNVAADDILLLFVESANQTIALGTANGFAEVTNSPQGTGTAGGTTATRLAVFWKRATGSDSNPVVTDPGDHAIAQIFAFRGCIKSGNPWDVTAGDVASSGSTSVSIPGATTTVDDCMIVAAVSNPTDTTTAQTGTWANSNLTDMGEFFDSNTTSGNGGGFGVATGRQARAGAYGTTTVVLATSGVQGRMSIALMPVLGYPSWANKSAANPLLRM